MSVENSPLIGQLREFSLNTSDWPIYKARINNYFQANGFADKEEKKRAILLNMLDEESYKLMYSLSSPTKPENKSFADLIKIFDSHFKPQKTPLAERYKFYDAKKSETESVKDWAARVRTLAVNCDFGGELEVCLRDKFVHGFSQGPVLDRLLEEKVNSKFEDVVVLAENKVAAQNHYVSSQKLATVKTEPLCHIRGKYRTGEGGSHGRYSRAHGEESKSEVRNKKQDQRCVVCGKANHTKDKCFFKNSSCNICGKKAHLATVCPQKRHNNYNQMKRHSNPKNKQYFVGESNGEQDGYFYNDDLNLYNIEAKIDKEKPFEIKLQVENVNMMFQIDSGASISAISDKLYYAKFSHIKLRPTSKYLYFYNGIKVQPLGLLNVVIKYKNIENKLDFCVMKNGGPPIVGRNFLNMYNFGFADMNYVKESDSLNNLISKYQSVFSPGLGKFTKGTVHINLKDKNVCPKFHKPRPVPYAIRDKVEREINRLLSLGILEPVDYSEWATPVVPVLKKGGDVRLCGDFKVTINPVIEVDQHPLPRIEDLFCALQNGVRYSKLDLSEAYTQVCVDESSKELLTLSTHKGLFRSNRLFYGIASAPSKFQKIMESLFTGLEGIVVFLDDILITGPDDKVHLERLEIALKILANAGLKLKLSKCKFFQEKIEYLGYVIDSEGLHTCESKTDAIQNAPRPTNVKQLQSLLGLVNYYGKFVNNLATRLYPLYNLLKKDVKWQWNKDCEFAFKYIKEALQSPNVLVHFNPNFPLKLTVDASAVGISAILSHVLPSGIEKPIAYKSRVLNKAEQAYSQIEKEGLAIIFGVLKFHQYLYYKKFTLITDHRPLISIFGSNKGIPQFTANRLRRWAVILSNYQYDIQYVQSGKNCADSLSRLPCNVDVCCQSEDIEMDYCNFFENKADIKIDFEDIRLETKNDKTISNVKEFILNGWPIKSNMASKYKCYYMKRNELYVSDDCVFWDHRIVIPEKLRFKMLTQLHATHMGIGKMKQLARMYFWWPKLNSDVEIFIKNCMCCMSKSNNPPKVKLNTWPYPNQPWERLHIDFLGPFMNSYYLIVTDAYTKWLEAFKLKSINASSTIRVLRSLFARFGIPNTIVSDNGAAFTSKEFQDFLSLNKINHITSPPFHPSSNGAAENSVKTVKNALKKALGDGESQSEDRSLCRFLFDYRNTPHVTTGVSPAKLMFGRSLRTRFDVILSDKNTKLQSNVAKQQQKQKRNYKGKKSIHFLLGEKVLVRDYRQINKVNWIKGVVSRILGNCTYLVEVCDPQRVWKRHANQMKKLLPLAITSNGENQTCSGSHNSSLKETEIIVDNTECVSDCTNVPVDVMPRPKRNIRPPDRLGYE